MSNTTKNLSWRYATKQYDTTKKLTADQQALLKEALRLAPSSFGLQPYKFIHVTDPAIRAQLRAAAWDQQQITDASDLFVLAALRSIDESYIDRYFALTAQVRNTTVEALKGYRDMIVSSVMGKPEGERLEWMKHQTYIPLGMALSVAAENNIDTTPMEGFDPAAFDTILGLEALNLTSCLVLAAGFRSSDDQHQNDAKVRFSESDLFIEK
jgi:nitroreductase